jgi:outer membrane lipoprotein carrier protein
LVQIMKGKILLGLILGISILAILTRVEIIWAEKGQVDSIVEHIQHWYDNISDYQAHFHQKTFSQTLRDTSEARGRIYFKKPHLIKWDYEYPEKQVYVIDHKYFWWYVPEDVQVVRRKAENVLQDATPLSFLAGIGNLKKDFEITLAEEPESDETGGTKFLHLTPRRQQINIKQMQLKLDAKTYRILGIVLVDPYGNTNDINFSEIKVNGGLEEEMFHFDPPPGVDIIDGDSREMSGSSKPL